MPDIETIYSDDLTDGELGEKRWSVISFDRREAVNLSYAEAVATRQRLETSGDAAGLCIVTNETAERLPRGEK